AGTGVWAGPVAAAAEVRRGRRSGSVLATASRRGGYRLVTADRRGRGPAGPGIVPGPGLGIELEPEPEPEPEPGLGIRLALGLELAFVAVARSGPVAPGRGRRSSGPTRPSRPPSWLW